MKTILLPALLFLAGCSSVAAQQPPLLPAQEPTLQQLAATDLDAAIAQATVDNDKVALQCWTALKDALPAINKPLPSVQGLASGIQAKRSIKARIAAGLPPAVVTGCANLYVEERIGLMKDLMAFLGLVR